MMPHKSLTMYHDVKIVLDAAIASGGAVYTLASRGKAVHWRHRAYTYRRLLREAKIVATMIPGLDPSTPYDTIELILPDEPRGSNGKSISGDVIIRQVQLKGVLTDKDGNVVNVTASPQEPVSDELDATALDLLSRHGG